ncbi:nucleolar protein 9 [Cimex lectularius]|uniref:Nucleolar protein 9 n=1 Tax=Cimex lectularius TaxID=79782 RepID=A0A8I6RDY9_CIMLE|nr:nucleolar protein 9 [Cimex lectularius]
MTRKHGRKRQKKFLYRANKKLKEERFGHILDKDTYEYFLRIAETLKLDNSDEEKGVLAENVLRETQGKEGDFTSHPLSARVLEGILPWASWNDLSRLRDAFAEKRHWAKNGCQAHVQESLIKDAGQRAQNGNEEKEECLEYIRQKSMFYLNNLEEQILEVNLNHLTRTCLEVCSGIMQEKGTSKQLSPLLPDVVKEYLSRFKKWHQFSGTYKEEVVSGLLQVVLRSASKCCPKACAAFINILIDNCLLNDYVKETQENTFFDNISRNSLLETMIEVSNAEVYEKIYTSFLKGGIKDLAKGKNSNFIIAKLLRSCPGKIQLEPIFEEMGTNYQAFMEYPQVLVALSEACLKCGIKQGDLIKNTKTTLSCDIQNGDQTFVKCLLWMTSPDKLDLKSQTSIHGSMILQNMLTFKKPIKIVEGLLGLNFDELKIIAEDPKGSRIFDAFVLSNSVGEKSRDRLINKFNDAYIDLAMTKFGSRVFDALWSKSSGKQREAIMKNMTRRILSNQYGSKIATMIDLNTYLTDRKNWNPKNKQ